MAAARDQAARIVRAGPETANDEAAPESGTPLADQLRTHVAEEARRRPAESHGTEQLGVLVDVARVDRDMPREPRRADLNGPPFLLVSPAR